jgi:ribose transport system substrate-binding protein
LLSLLGLSAALGAVGLILAGCPPSGQQNAGTGGPSPAAEGSPAAGGKGEGTGKEGGKTITYAIVAKMLTNPVFDLARRGAETAAKDLEAKTGNKYVIKYQAPQTPANGGAEQAQILEQLTASGVDGVSIAVVDANAVSEPMKEAVGKKIPVMCFDSDAPTTGRAAFYAINDIGIGTALAEQLIAAAGADAKGEVAILSGQSSAPNLQNRVKGVVDTLKAKAPGMTVLPILYCEDSSDKAVELIQTTLRSKPDLRGFVFVGGWPLFVDNALEAVKDPKRTIVVSADTLPKEIEYLEKGQVACLIGQKYFGWGEESVKTLEAIRTGQKPQTGPNGFIDAGFDLVFKSPTPAQRALAKGNVRVFSVDEYKKQWQDWASKGSNQ